MKKTSFSYLESSRCLDILENGGPGKKDTHIYGIVPYTHTLSPYCGLEVIANISVNVDVVKQEEEGREEKRKGKIYLRDCDI